MLLVLQVLRWSVPIEIGELHIELEKIGEFIVAGCRDERILMNLFWPCHGRLMIHGGFDKRKSEGEKEEAEERMRGGDEVQ